MKYLVVLTGILSILLTSCCAPKIETSGLVLNEDKNEFFLDNKAISEAEASEYFDNMKPSQIVVSVEGDHVSVATKQEITAFYSELFKAYSKFWKSTSVKRSKINP